MAGTKRDDKMRVSKKALEKRLRRKAEDAKVYKIYADTTEQQKVRMKEKWESYCNQVGRDAAKTLNEYQPARIENFLYWYLCGNRVLTTSSLKTYYHQLNLIYREQNQGYSPRRESMKVIDAYIERDLKEEFKLDDVEAIRPSLDAADFKKVVDYLMASNGMHFSHERSRLQVLFYLLLGAYVGQRSNALRNIRYGDVTLYVQRAEHTQQERLLLDVSLRYTKDAKKRRRYKTVTFQLDDHPGYCIVTVFLSLAFLDGVFANTGLTRVEQIFTLRTNLNAGTSLKIPLKAAMHGVPLFRNVQGDGTQLLAFQTMNEHLNMLGLQSLGVKFTTYCLRRAMLNAVNNTPGIDASIRDLIADHDPKSSMFARNYISRRIPVDVQSLYLGRAQETRYISAAHRMSGLADPRRPLSLTQAQKKSIRFEPSLSELAARRKALHERIRKRYGEIQIAKEDGSRSYRKLVRLDKKRKSLIRQRELKLLSETQKLHDEKAPIEDVERQLNGLGALDGTQVSAKPSPMHFLFEERESIAQLYLGGWSCGCDSSRNGSACTCERGLIRRTRFIEDLISLGSKQSKASPYARFTESETPASSLKSEIIEAQGSTCVQSEQLRMLCSTCWPDDPPKDEHETNDKGCRLCLFCYCNGDLAVSARRKHHYNKWDLNRHLGRCRADIFGDGNEKDRDKDKDTIACPHPLCAQVKPFKKPQHLKTHIIKQHGIGL